SAEATARNTRVRAISSLCSARSGVSVVEARSPAPGLPAIVGAACESTAVGVSSSRGSASATTPILLRDAALLKVGDLVDGETGFAEDGGAVAAERGWRAVALGAPERRARLAQPVEVEEHAARAVLRMLGELVGRQHRLDADVADQHRLP